MKMKMKMKMTMKMKMRMRMRIKGIDAKDDQKVQKGQFKMQSCLNINYLMEDYTPIETTTDEMTLMLVKYKTMKAIETPNMKDIRDQDGFDPSFVGNETSISDQHDRPKRGDSPSLEPFGNPTYVMIFDQGVKNDPDFSFEPSFILSNGHYYVSIERNEDRYRSGKVSFSFESSVSSRSHLLSPDTFHIHTLFDCV